MKKVILYVMISATLFSTMEVALKIAGAGFDAFQLTFLRFTIGGLFLLPFALKQIKKDSIIISRNDYFYLLLLGIVCIPVAMVFFQLGIIYSNAITAAVVFSINPVFTVFFTHFITEEKLTGIKIVALITGLLGVIFMVAPWNIALGDSLIGASYSVLAALLFGLYSALGRRTIKRLKGLPQTAISFILGSAIMYPLLLVLGKPVIANITLNNLWLVLYVGIMVTGVGYLTYFLAMEEGDAITASFTFFLKPGLAPIFAVLILHEVVNINDIWGILLVFIASYIIIRENRRKKSNGS